MTKKQMCTTCAPIATMVLSNATGAAIHRIDYGIEDYVYASVTCGDITTYHKCKVYYTTYGEAFFYVGKMRLNLSDFMRI